MADKRKAKQRLTIATHAAAGVYAGVFVIGGGLLAWALATGADTAWAVLGAGAMVLAVTLAPLALRPVASGDGRDVGEALKRFAEEAALSDDARRIMHRRQEREVLRRAIEEDITARDWDAAMVLVKELAERFGYRADAEQFRARIEGQRFEHVDRSVREAVAKLDGLIERGSWDEARGEAERIIRLYPDSDRVDGLRNRVESARLRYKHELERRFLEAAQGERVDDALELLRELDAYLTEAEAEPYQEVARGVIGRARENLGAAFKLALQDRDWPRAVEVGERIMADFPNTRMAEEIREMIDSLRERAVALRTTG